MPALVTPPTCRFPLKLAVTPVACVKEELTLKLPPTVRAPVEVNDPVVIVAKVPAPALLIVAKAVPEAGVDIVLNLPVKAETLPVEAAVKSNTPVEVLIPNVVSNPLTQFCNIRKLELIVTLDPDIESEPKISVIVTDAIF